MTKKSWSDLSPRRKSLIVVGGAVELALTTAALLDLARRPSAQVRGPKAMWVLGCFIQPVGPLAYLALGRRRRG